MFSSHIYNIKAYIGKTTLKISWYKHIFQTCYLSKVECKDGMASAAAIVEVCHRRCPGKKWKIKPWYTVTVTGLAETCNLWDIVCCCVRKSALPSLCWKHEQMYNGIQWRWPGLQKFKNLWDIVCVAPVKVRHCRCSKYKIKPEYAMTVTQLGLIEESVW